MTFFLTCLLKTCHLGWSNSLIAFFYQSCMLSESLDICVNDRSEIHEWFQNFHIFYPKSSRFAIFIKVEVWTKTSNGIVKLTFVHLRYCLSTKIQAKKTFTYYIQCFNLSRAKSEKKNCSAGFLRKKWNFNIWVLFTRSGFFQILIWIFEEVLKRLSLKHCM